MLKYIYSSHCIASVARQSASRLRTAPETELAPVVLYVSRVLMLRRLVHGIR